MTAQLIAIFVYACVYVLLAGFLIARRRVIDQVVAEYLRFCGQPAREPGYFERWRLVASARQMEPPTGSVLHACLGKLRRINAISLMLALVVIGFPFVGYRLFPGSH
jgi:hypothetical protein